MSWKYLTLRKAFSVWQIKLNQIKSMWNSEMCIVGESIISKCNTIWLKLMKEDLSTRISIWCLLNKSILFRFFFFKFQIYIWCEMLSLLWWWQLICRGWKCAKWEKKKNEKRIGNGNDEHACEISIHLFIVT